MIKEKIPVYFVPGLAASKEIFRNIKLPEDRYKTTIIDWLIPEEKEPISDYAKRMASFVKEENAVLIGVSFGGVMVQEMSLHLILRKLIIISSVKSKSELPKRLRIIRKLRAYKLAPTSLIVSSKDLTKYAVGPKSKKRLKIYDEYLHVRDKRYLPWAIENMVCWDREEVDLAVHHIHGNADMVFPIKYINSSEIIEGGTHIMLLNKATAVTKKIVDIIEDN
ncbi:alpha/beta fold hydrolase [Patiriisocius marinus]|uniref:Alpha/beta hydrolase n=1 Tax=Patiriisocius marinus TaxID=1397112 RepID=A0A5J4IW35_9FLAO|nr:alpha/beta hydrolase [Patiriisocius marinus]GER59164.1 alpha/beta hydrolase [Patiriisocius marinus]